VRIRALPDDSTDQKRGQSHSRPDGSRHEAGVTTRSPDPLDQVPRVLAAWRSSHPDASWDEIESALGQQIERARAQLGEEQREPREDGTHRGHAVYNVFAARNTDRLEALSDGVFAFAMTLLVFNLHVPVAAAIHTDGDLWHALLDLAPHLMVYVLSFMTLGIFWVGQQTMLAMTARSDRNLAWINIGILLMVTLVPFSTALLAGFPTYTVAVLEYWLNLLLLGGFLFMLRLYAHRADLDRADVTPEMITAAYRRITIAQALYAVAALLIPIPFSHAALSVGRRWRFSAIQCQPVRLVTRSGSASSFARITSTAATLSAMVG